LVYFDANSARPTGIVPQSLQTAFPLVCLQSVVRSLFLIRDGIASYIRSGNVNSISEAAAGPLLVCEPLSVGLSGYEETDGPVHERTTRKFATNILSAR
jgi:hypothetical protein